MPCKESMARLAYGGESLARGAGEAQFYRQ